MKGVIAFLCILSLTFSIFCCESQRFFSHSKQSPFVCFIRNAEPVRDDLEEHRSFWQKQRRRVEVEQKMSKENSSFLYWGSKQISPVTLKKYLTADEQRKLERDSWFKIRRL